MSKSKYTETKGFPYVVDPEEEGELDHVYRGLGVDIWFFTYHHGILSFIHHKKLGYWQSEFVRYDE